MNPTLFRLIGILANLYPTPDSSYLFVAQMNLPSAWIKMDQPPFERWYSIVKEAESAGMASVAVEVALARFPNHRELLELKQALLPTSPLPVYDLGRVVPPTATPNALDRILGGALTASFPDCCAIGDELDYFCTGTLIAPRQILTAKHCAATAITRIFAKGYDVSDAESGEVIAVVSMQLHPEADLMILTLAQDALTPIRSIATSAEIEQLSPTTCTLVGFGTIDIEGTVGYGIKRRVETPILSLLCGASEDSLDYGCIQGIEMVAGQRGLNRDTCQGDSGGPLYVQYLDGSYHLLGVTSRGISGGRNCGDGGIYVRADKFIDWIRQECKSYK